MCVCMRACARVCVCAHLCVCMCLCTHARIPPLIDFEWGVHLCNHVWAPSLTELLVPFTNNISNSGNVWARSNDLQDFITQPYADHNISPHCVFNVIFPWWTKSVLLIYAGMLHADNRQLRARRIVYFCNPNTGRYCFMPRLPSPGCLLFQSLRLIWVLKPCLLILLFTGQPFHLFHCSQIICLALFRQTKRLFRVVWQSNGIFGWSRQLALPRMIRPCVVLLSLVRTGKGEGRVGTISNCEWQLLEHSTFVWKFGDHQQIGRG